MTSPAPLPVPSPAPDAAGRSDRPLGIGLLLLLAALGAMGPLSVDMYLPALPLIGTDLDAGDGGAQRTLAAYFAGLAIGQLVAGPLSDRFGRMRPLLGGLALYVAGSIGCALATSVDMLVAWRFVQALGGASAMVVPRAILRDHQTGAQAARTVSLMMLVSGSAPVVAPLLGGLLVTHSGWRSIFAALALAGTALLVAVVATLSGRGGGTRATPAVPVLAALRSGFAVLLRDPGFLAHAGGGACATAAMFAYISGSSFVIITLHGISPAHFGWFFAVNVTALVGAAQLNRLLLRRWSLPSILRCAAWGGALAGGALVACAWSGLGGLWAIVGCAFLILASLGFIGPNAGILALEAHGERAGLAAALMGSLQFAVAAVTSWLVGALHDGTALPMALVMAGAITASAVVLSCAPRPRSIAHRPQTIATAEQLTLADD